jgi:hypothetical protein
MSQLEEGMVLVLVLVLVLLVLAPVSFLIFVKAEKLHSNPSY